MQPMLKFVYVKNVMKSIKKFPLTKPQLQSCTCKRKCHFIEFRIAATHIFLPIQFNVELNIAEGLVQWKWKAKSTIKFNFEECRLFLIEYTKLHNHLYGKPSQCDRAFKAVRIVIKADPITCYRSVCGRDFASN